MPWSRHKAGSHRGGPPARGESYLTSYPGSRQLIPGVSFASRLPPTQYQKLYAASEYDLNKSVEEPTVAKEQEKIQVNNRPEPTVQLGFGSDDLEIPEITDNEIDSDIATTSLKKVDPKVLSAFENPVFKVKKEMFTSGKGQVASNAINLGVKKFGKKHFLKIVPKK